MVSQIGEGFFEDPTCLAHNNEYIHVLFNTPFKSLTYQFELGECNFDVLWTEVVFECSVMEAIILKGRSLKYMKPSLTVR